MNSKYLSTIITICYVIIFSASLVWAQKSPYDWALIDLDYIRKEKIEHLKRFTERLHNFAQKAATDQKITKFFEINRHYFNVVGKEEVPVSLTIDIEDLRNDFARYYFANYSVFYNILFVDYQGVAFYTLRKEMGTNVNLIQQSASTGCLGEALAQKPRREVFIDFYSYEPSSEPAAFFIEPVVSNGAQVGWIVLQCAVNKLNSIFASTDDLGQTGETFLVNHDGLMLTESYFKGNSTILKQHLDDRNIQAKFQEKKGHLVVTDYRGATALSSFEVFVFLGSKWLVVAKIDKNEITTAHYQRHKKYYTERLLECLQKSPLPASDIQIIKPQGVAQRVDMDEFLKADNGEKLETWGISTCTAFVATMLDRFCYLAHISAKDKMNNGSDTDLLGQITKKIKSFDIYRCERKKIVFVTIAPHLNSLPNIINQLIKDGFFLSQIRIAYNPAAEKAAVLTDYKNNSVCIKWTLPGDKNRIVFTGVEQTYNAGEIIEKIMTETL